MRGSRSTVGTLTELYDLFRLLFAKVATPYCPRCGKEIRKWDTSQVMSLLTQAHQGKKVMIIFHSNESIEELGRRGYRRLFLNGSVVEIDEIGEGGDVAPFAVVLDRLVIRDDPRLSDSIEMAWREGNERLRIALYDEQSTEPAMLTFSAGNSCDVCDIELPEPTPLLFSFNHPVGACPACRGFGRIISIDYDLAGF